MLQIILILLIRFTEPLSFTFMFPFLIFMVEDFGVAGSKSEIGYYVGVLAASFALAQFATGLLWGHLSDRLGRKPTSIVGLLGLSVSLMLFGFCKGFKTALVCRFLCGVFSGNVSIVKSMMTEISNDSNRKKIFSYLPIVYVLGTAVGPVLGGFLSNLAKWSSSFQIHLFIKYPYFAPCAVCSIICFMTSVACIIHLKETNPIILSPPSHHFETTPLIQEASGPDSRGFAPGQTTPNQTGGSESKLSISKTTWLGIIGAGVISFQATLFDELLALWLATSASRGGLELETTGIGKLMSLIGFYSLVVQVGLNAKTQERYGSCRVYRAACVGSVFVFALIPVASNFYHSTNILYHRAAYIYLLVLCVSRACLNVFSLTSTNIIIANSSDHRKIGFINGLDQSMKSLSRALGPLVCGIIFSWSISDVTRRYPLNHVFTWYVLSFVSILNLLVAQYIRLDA